MTIPTVKSKRFRYDYLDDKEQAKRIENDFLIVSNDSRFRKNMAITHCNEFADIYNKAEYYSDSPFKVTRRN